MTLFIVAILVLLGGIIAYLASKKGFVAAIALVIAAALCVLSCVTTVPTGHTGVVTTFGHVENFTLDAGVHMVKPWQQVVKMDNRVQKQTVKLACFSSDIQEVKTVYTVNYQINKANAQELYRTVGVNYYETVVEPNIMQSVKNVMAQYTAENLVGARDELAGKIESNLAADLERYNIEMVSSAVEDMDFTDEFTNAVEAKQVAQQNKLRAQTEQEQKTMEAREAANRAKIDADAAAEVAKIAAQADLEVTKIQADAAEYAGQKEAAKNKAIAEWLTPELINYYYIQQWNGKLPESYVGSDSVSAIVGIPGASGTQNNDRNAPETENN
jgi:regulator of protease activity HflC (stomatin/prohibitin superfamily)